MRYLGREAWTFGRHTRFNLACSRRKGCFMLYSLLADLVLVLHLLFIGFIVLGGFLVLRFQRIVWIHVPAVLWGALIEFANWICPLTPLENELRIRAGGVGYAGSFVERYLLPIIYPEALTRGVQLVLGSTVLGVNLAVYAYVLSRRRRERH